MTRHIVDTDHATDAGLRLRRFLTIARRDGRHPAITQMLQQPRSRAAVSGRVAGLLGPQRARPDQARTSFS